MATWKAQNPETGMTSWVHKRVNKLRSDFEDE